MKVWQPRPITHDPPDLEEKWIKYVQELLKEQSLTKSQIESAKIGLKSYSALKPGKARFLIGELTKRAEKLR